MDFRLHRGKSLLSDTCYIEIGPGKYSGKHWQEGFVFVDEDAFACAEGIANYYFPDYDHFGMNDLPKATGLLIIAEWRSASTSMTQLEPHEAARLLRPHDAARPGLVAVISAHRKEMQALLNDLADEFERLYRTDEWVCVLGM